MTRRARRPFPIAAAAATLALALGACGEDRDEASTTDAAPATTTGQTKPPGVSVTETEFKLTPTDLSVPKTGKVTITVRNEGAVEHALEVEGEGGAGEVETDPIAPGGTATIEFDFKEPGNYEWYCPIGDHKERGMEGKIVVAGASAGSGTDDKGGDRERDGKGGDDSGRSSDDSGTSPGGGMDDESGGSYYPGQ